MGRQKLARFALNAQRENVIEPGKEIFTQIKGKWREFFKNNNPIVLEVGCGRGEYTTGLAVVYPDRNFVGIDIKGARIWKGSSVAIENKLTNAAFLRVKAQNISDHFDKGEVNEIWVTFPDPRPKDKDERRRLTNSRFLNIYKELLVSDGIVHFKTDNEGLFDYTLQEVLNVQVPVKDLVYTKDLYNSDMLAEHYGIQTTYERKFLGIGTKINYMRFRFN